jgi:hypothetical protein
MILLQCVTSKNIDNSNFEVAKVVDLIGEEKGN